MTDVTNVTNVTNVTGVIDVLNVTELYLNTNSPRSTRRVFTERFNRIYEFNTQYSTLNAKHSTLNTQR